MRRMNLLVLVGLLAVACGNGTQEARDDLPPGCKEDSGLRMSGLQFEPKCMVISTTLITIDNDDRVRHSFTIDGTATDVEIKGGLSGGVDLAGSIEPGVPTPFHCKFHPTMVGEVLLRTG